MHGSVRKLRITKFEREVFKPWIIMKEEEKKDSQRHVPEDSVIHAVQVLFYY